MDIQCVICSEIIVLHRYYRKGHKTCPRPECMKAYRNQRASERDISTRAARRTINEQNGLEMVACAICGERFELIQYSHLRRHGITIAQYKEQYPYAPLINNKIKEIRSRASIVQSRYLKFAGKEPDNHLFEFLTGALLGDGSLDKRHDKINARYAEGGKNELYVKWKYDLLQQYFPCSWKERVSSPHTKTGKRYCGWWLRTTVHPLLTQWHSQWYKEGKKIVPQVIVEKYLNEFALAVWFCDDGHCSKSKHRSYLYTMAFSPEEVIFLSELLDVKFGLKNNILKNKQGQMFINFTAASSNKIREILAYFSLPGMDYKSQEPVKICKSKQSEIIN